jgi:transposase
MELKVLGIDLSKNLFQLHGVDPAGRAVLRKRLRRDQLLPFVAALPPCTIGIEACASAFHWAREFERAGRMVRIVSPQFVKPFVRGNKNDGNDAEAICEAVQRPNMRFVPAKTIAQQDIQSLHRCRQRLVNHRTALISQMRGILLDRGIAFGKSASRARAMMPRIIADPDNGLTVMAREMLASLFEFLRQLDERIRDFDRRIEAVFRELLACQRIAKVEGVGPKTATAIVAAVGDAKDFENGRHMAAWLGLVPRHQATGGRTVMGGISKRGDQHLRTLLVHGARAVVRISAGRTDARSQWVKSLVERRGTNRAIVAVANKNARIIWSLLARGEDYRPAVAA